MRKLIFLLCTLIALPTYADCEFKANTASQAFLIGPFLDQTDGITAETGLTIANTDIRLSKAGGNMAAKDSGGGTHDEDGLYQIILDATDTDTEGTLQLSIQDVANHTPVWHECMVLGADEYDRKYGVTAALTSRDTGLMLLTTITTATSPTELDLAAGASNNDAYNNLTATFVGGTEECERKISDYTGAGAILFIESACPFTLASDDTVRIHAGGSGTAQQTAQLDLDVITGSSGALLDANAIDASTIATDAIDADALADDAIDEIWAKIIETAGATYTAECALAIGLAESAGTFTTAGNVRTYKDPSGATDRIVGTISGTTRSGITVSCP